MTQCSHSKHLIAIPISRQQRLSPCRRKSEDQSLIDSPCPCVRARARARATLSVGNFPMAVSAPSKALRTLCRGLLFPTVPNLRLTTSPSPAVARTSSMDDLRRLCGVGVVRRAWLGRRRGGRRKICLQGRAEPRKTMSRKRQTGSAGRRRASRNTEEGGREIGVESRERSPFCHLAVVPGNRGLRDRVLT